MGFVSVFGFFCFFFLLFVCEYFSLFFLLECVDKLTKNIKSTNLIETQTRSRQEPFDFMSVRVADEKKKLHPCAIQLCDK